MLEAKTRNLIHKPQEPKNKISGSGCTTMDISASASLLCFRRDITYSSTSPLQPT